MKGKDLQKAIKNSGKSVTDIIKDSGIPKSTFFTLYKEPEVASHYLEKIRHAGVSLDNFGLLDNDPRETPEFLKARLFLLEQNMTDLRNYIKGLEKNNNAFIETNHTLNEVVNAKLVK